jgi:hypothetical protein
LHVVSPVAGHTVQPMTVNVRHKNHRVNSQTMNNAPYKISADRKGL